MSNATPTCDVSRCRVKTQTSQIRDLHLNGQMVYEAQGLQVTGSRFEHHSDLTCHLWVSVCGSPQHLPRRRPPTLISSAIAFFLFSFVGSEKHLDLDLNFSPSSTVPRDQAHHAGTHCFHPLSSPVSLSSTSSLDSVSYKPINRHALYSSSTVLAPLLRFHFPLTQLMMKIHHPTFVLFHNSFAPDFLLFLID